MDKLHSALVLKVTSCDWSKRVRIGSRPSWKQVGGGCSNQMQVAQGQVLARVSALVQAAIRCCILLLLVPKMPLYSSVDKDLRVEMSCIIFLIIATYVALERFYCSFRT